MSSKQKRCLTAVRLPFPGSFSSYSKQCQHPHVHTQAKLDTSRFRKLISGLPCADSDFLHPIGLKRLLVVIANDIIVGFVQFVLSVSIFQGAVSATLLNIILTGSVACCPQLIGTSLFRLDEGGVEDRYLG